MGGGSKLCHNAHIDGTDGVQAVPVNAAIDPSTVAQDKDIYVTCNSWCVCAVLGRICVDSEYVFLIIRTWRLLSHKAYVTCCKHFLRWMHDKVVPVPQVEIPAGSIHQA